MRLIDADALKNALEIEQYNDYDDLLRTERLIDNAPPIKTFTLADIEEQYRKGLEKGLEERPHGECNQCRYYEGVHGVQGHAPCSFWKIGGVLWNDFCSRYEKEGEAE